jgi:hypothetical protein
MATQTFTVSRAPGNGGATVAATQNVPLTADTHRFLNDGRTVLSFDKGAGACTVTVTTPGTVRGVAVADPTYTLAASTEDQIIGPFAPDVFNDSDGYVSFAISEQTGITCSVIGLP